MRFLRNLHLILSHSIFTSKLNYDDKTRTDIYGEDEWEGVLMNILGWEIHFICCKRVSYTDVFFETQKTVYLRFLYFSVSKDLYILPTHNTLSSI